MDTWNEERKFRKLMKTLKPLAKSLPRKTGSTSRFDVLRRHHIAICDYSLFVFISVGDFNKDERRKVTQWIKRLLSEKVDL